MVTSRTPTQWQLLKGTLVSVVFREIYRRFARYSSGIHCTVSGARCFSADLPQGGLELPVGTASLSKNTYTLPFLHSLTCSTGVTS